MEALCILCDIEPDWINIKNLFIANKLDSKLNEIDKDDLTEEQLIKLKAYVNDPEFKLNTMNEFSTATGFIGQWVINMYSYARVYKTLKPKIERFRKLSSEVCILKYIIKLKKEIEQDELNIQLKSKEFEELYNEFGPVRENHLLSNIF